MTNTKFPNAKSQTDFCYLGFDICHFFRVWALPLVIFLSFIIFFFSLTKKHFSCILGEPYIWGCTFRQDIYKWIMQAECSLYNPVFKISANLFEEEPALASVA